MKELLRDKISNLPDDILHVILSFLSMKYAVRTAILSTRWRYLWTSVRDLDFGEEFGIGRKPDEIARIVGRFLKLHSGRNVERLRLCCYPDDENHSSEVGKWIEFAVRRGVQVLDLDFSHGHFSSKEPSYDCRQPFKLPSCLYNCGSSLQSLKLSLCDFNPPTFHGFSSLQTLHLIQVSITEEMIEALLSCCPVLENLNMNHCTFEIDNLRISAPDLPLKCLTLVNCLVWGVELSAPSLLSIEYCGFPIIWFFKNTPSLVAARFDYRCAHISDPNIFMGRLIPDLSSVEVLTICSCFLMNLFEYEAYEGMPITPFHNLKELQLIMDRITYQYFIGIYSFFRICPCPLEKLYVEIQDFTSNLQGNEDECSKQLREDFDGVFYQLKTIKIEGFRGLESEIQLVNFFLEKAVALETLILIVPHKSHPEKNIEDTPKQFSEMPLQVLYDQLLLLPKASAHAKIILSKQDNTGLYIVKLPTIFM